MKYKNTKTGVVINVQSVIRGGDWIALDHKQEAQPQKATPPEEKQAVPVNPVQPTNKPAVGNDDTFESITVKEIKQELDANGIKYSKTAKKQELYNLMMGM